MKIVVALHDYLPRHTGGSEIHAHQTARELARRGHDVTALFTERDLAAREGEVRAGRLDGVATREVVHQREYQDVRESFEEERSLALFQAELARLRPEVVHFHHLALWGSRCIPAAKASGARVVVTLHDFHLLCDVSTLLRPDGELCTAGPRGECSACLRRHPLLPERWGGRAPEAAWAAAARARFERHRADLGAADVVLAPSRFLAGIFESAGFRPPGSIQLLKAGYPGPVLPPRRRDPGRPLRVGYVGGIYFSKGVHVLVEAFRQLTGEAVELELHGHLDWFPEYVAGLRRAAAGARVRFAGPFEPSRIDEVLGRLDLLVVPSVWYENMPITIHEAHRHGLPVVVTALGGMAEAVEHGVTGLTFPRGDPVALAEAIRRLARDAALYDRLAASRPRVPTLEEIVERLERVYAGQP
ncbi:MAG TPA: glycosyltransferase family 4 protein [Planctomycetota bacterium]